MKSRQRDTWMEAFSGLGESLMQVLRAELAVLGDGWKRSGRHMAIVLALFGAAMTFVVWIPPLLIAALVHALHETLGWPMWHASLVVTAALVVVAGVLLMGARQILVKRVENPLTFFRRRLDDHLQWWRGSLLRERQIEGDSDDQTKIGD